MEFSTLLVAVERNARRGQRTVPTEEERSVVCAAFWSLMRRLADWERTSGRSPVELEATRSAVREVTDRWFLRCAVWNRALVKPHGFPGDYRLLEWMYDLERDPGNDPTAPLMQNLFDVLFGTVHSGQAVWHRRRWYADLVRAQLQQRGQDRVRLVDVACGGARYLRDVAVDPALAGRLDVTLVDQDPAALAFAAPRLTRLGVHVAAVCGRVRDLADLLAGQDPLDLAVTTGLLDYLEPADAAALLQAMAASTRTGGVIAASNFAVDDPSRMVKDWINDWRLLYRDEEELVACFPAGAGVAVSRSPDGGLLYAQQSVP